MQKVHEPGDAGFLRDFDKVQDIRPESRHDIGNGFVMGVEGCLRIPGVVGTLGSR